MRRRIQIIIVVGAILAFAIVEVGNFIDRLRPETPPASEPNKPLKWTLYPRR
jgi:hypothetical protein